MYGETSFDLICEVMKHTKMTENDVFVDLGSGKMIIISTFSYICACSVHVYNRMLQVLQVLDTSCSCWSSGPVSIIVFMYLYKWRRAENICPYGCACMNY